ncbi:hypothetical protein C8Q79DRAFT_1008097 [Trametes meyenii]|nr:hypothetical protein C8Q79DRAFT_1008097 [Trametes meyenii]
MKFFLFTIVLAIFSTVQAQNVVINAPSPQSTLSPGQQFVVDVVRGPTRLVSQDVSIAIGLKNCDLQSCDDIDTTLSFGELLFAGPYAPERHGDEFSQNYTVTVPDNFPTGNAALSVVHFYLLTSTDTSALLIGTHEGVVVA